MRRAWIEIATKLSADDADLVALREESVDRNDVVDRRSDFCFRSLSVRRAWIEI